jgi:hypothetical protein
MTHKIEMGDFFFNSCSPRPILFDPVFLSFSFSFFSLFSFKASSPSSPQLVPYLTMKADDFLFFQPIVYHLYLEGKHYKDTHSCLRTMYGSMIPELPTIKKWYASIESGTFVFGPRKFGGRSMNTEITKALSLALLDNPKASTKFLASSLGIDHHTVKFHLTTGLGMKQYKLQWVPHTLSTQQKEQRQKGARILQEALEYHQEFGFKRIITGDKSWFFYDNESDRIWLRPEEELPKKANKIISSKKIMLTVFFSGERIIHWSYLPRGTTMNSTTFIGTVLRPMLDNILSTEQPEAEKEIGFFFKFFSYAKYF